MKNLELTGENLSVESLVLHAQRAERGNDIKIGFSAGARKKIQASEAFVKKIADGKKAVYGINTGFGRFAEVKVSQSKLEELQENIIRSHACGVGKPLGRSLVMAMWLMRLNVLARGHSGVKWETVDKITDYLHAGILAQVPSRGSVGASGDLCPSAHAVLGFLGEGQATYLDAEEVTEDSAAKILKKLKKTPLKLGPKEGLALINGTQLTTVLASFALFELKNLVKVANLSAALMIEGLRASHHIFHPKTLRAKNQRGVEVCGKDIAAWIGTETDISKSHANCGRVQDAYSLRCAPLVHGTIWDEIMQCEEILDRELNSSTDNPLLFAESEESVSCGNFHALYPARVSDRLASAAATLASISERRTALAMNAGSSQLPTFLIKDGGLNSGFMMIHVSAASCVSEAKSNSFPASVDSIPTNDDKEDHVSMGPTAGFKAIHNIYLLRRVLTIEIMAAAQALDLVRPLKTSQKLERVHKEIRTHVAFMDKDRSTSAEIEALSSKLETLLG